VTNADIDANHRRPPVVDREVPLDLNGERDEPAIGGPADRGGQNPSGALLQAASQLASRLMGLEHPDPRKLNVLAVGQHLDRAGGEATGVPGTTLPLEPWNADGTSLAGPDRESLQFLSARASPSSPEE
jgi:hypothetical protein